MDEVLVHIQMLYSNFKLYANVEAQIEKEVIKYNSFKERLLTMWSSTFVTSRIQIERLNIYIN